MLNTISFRRSRLTQTFVAFVLAVLLIAMPAAAAEPQPPLSLSAGLKFSSRYRANCWQPIHVELRNDGSTAVEGTVVVPLADPQAPSAMVLPVTVPPRAQVVGTVWAYFPPLALPAPPAQPRHPQRQQPQPLGEVPPLAVAEFRGRDGALLARAQLSGVPLSGFSSSKDGADGSDEGELILVVGRRERLEDELYDANALIAALSEGGGPPMAVANISIDRVPREATGLQAVKAIVLDSVDPESFAASQREAMLQYLRGGGVIVLAAPIASTDTAGTWLAPLLPVKLIGSREAREVAVGDGNVLKLREVVPIIEAVENAGAGGSGVAAQVLLRDRNYVHVAARPFGLGKIVFTSFPINALDAAQPQATALWEQLLALRRPQWEWNRTRLGAVRHTVLGAMIGRRVPPWGVAAGVAAGYLLFIAAAQLLFAGPARPRAFVVSLAAAGVLAVTLVGMGMVRRSDSVLQSARLAVVDVTPDGGGWAHESIAYVGADLPDMKLQAGGEAVMLRPALADARNRPAVGQQPFGADHAQVFPERIERVWEASGPADPSWRLRAVAQFGRDGLTLDVENGLHATIESPLVIWNGRAVAMADLPPGRTTVRAFAYNPRGEFAGLDAIASEQSKRRARVIGASLAPPADESSSGNIAAAAAAAAPDAPPPPPMLVGWVAAAAAGDRAWLVREASDDNDKVEAKSMTLIRAPLHVRVAPPESPLTIPAALVHVDTGRLPYDHARGESVATPQPGSWRIRFAAPPQTGRVRPNRVTVTARASVPAHTLRLRPASRAAPADERAWSRTVGQVEMTLDCTERDYDAAGGVEIVLDVESHDPAGGVAWQISDLVATIDGVIAGPPPPIVLGPTTREANAAREGSEGSEGSEPDAVSSQEK